MSLFEQICACGAGLTNCAISGKQPSGALSGLRPEQPQIAVTRTKILTIFHVEAARWQPPTASFAGVVPPRLAAGRQPGALGSGQPRRAGTCSTMKPPATGRTVAPALVAAPRPALADICNACTGG